MVTVECPCCDRVIRIEPETAELRCEECAVTAPIAPDEPSRPLAIAA